jgi:hypothetical protein
MKKQRVYRKPRKNTIPKDRATELELLAAYIAKGLVTVCPAQTVPDTYTIPASLNAFEKEDVPAL